jgi:hypothetical protein
MRLFFSCRTAVSCAIVALSLFSLATLRPALGGYVVVMGDATPTFALQYDIYEGFEGNRAFFRNLRAGGDSVPLLGPSSGNTDLVRDFYNRLLPGSADESSALVTNNLLQGVDLLVASRVIREFSASETEAIGGLLGRGGNLLLIVEPPPVRDAESVRSSVHALLDKLHVNIRLLNPLFDGGTRPVTGDRIATHPLTYGVTAFNYGKASNVQGGTPLFFGSTGYPFVAAAFVPEPSTFVITSICILAFSTRRRRSDTFLSPPS